jgi:outer membrane protein assembly factor BamB
MLGGRNNVIAFAGSAFSGRANANSEQYDQRVLSSFNIGTKAWEWATQNAYLTQPAVAKGVIYAGRNRPMSLDAIDETSGKILWSWAPTPELGDTEFHRNIIVTRNLLFVGTNTGVYAVDLATHKPVWRYAATGMMAISANRTLYIATGATTSDGKLVAIKLK